MRKNKNGISSLAKNPIKKPKKQLKCKLLYEIKNKQQQKKIIEIF